MQEKGTSMSRFMYIENQLYLPKMMKRFVFGHFKFNKRLSAENSCIPNHNCSASTTKLLSGKFCTIVSLIDVLKTLRLILMMLKCKACTCICIGKQARNPIELS